MEPPKGLRHDTTKEFLQIVNSTHVTGNDIAIGRSGGWAPGMKIVFKSATFLLL
jgi:hypothetical protein